MSNDATDSSASSRYEPLTFDPAAAPDAAACQACGTALRGSYHMVGENMVCAKCRYAAEERQGAVHGAGGLLRAVAFGAGAAIVGAAGYYAFVKVTSVEWALLTALVGLGVGRAVRVGSRGHGGRKFQVVAVTLTYFAMAAAYLPFIAAGFAHAANKSPAAATTGHTPPPSLRAYADSTAALQRVSAESVDSMQTSAEPASATPAAPAPNVAEPVGATRLPLTTSIAIVIAALAAGLLTTPVVVAVASPISGLLIAYALYRAWKSNAGGLQPVAVSGPFRLQPLAGRTDAP